MFSFAGTKGRNAPFFLVSWSITGLVISGLVGCATANPAINVIGAALRQWLPGGQDPTLTANLNPNYQYLRVEQNGSPPALMVLAYQDNHKTGIVDVWFSAGQEILKMHNGIVVATVGTPFSFNQWWPNEAPSWPSTHQSVNYTVVQDETAADGRVRYGLSWTVERSLIAQPPAQEVKYLSKHLPVSIFTRWTWYEDRSPGRPVTWVARDAALPGAPAVYSYQCIGPEQCLRLLKWPVAGV